MDGGTGGGGIVGRGDGGGGRGSRKRTWLFTRRTRNSAAECRLGGIALFQTSERFTVHTHRRVGRSIFTTTWRRTHRGGYVDFPVSRSDFETGRPRAPDESNTEWRCTTAFDSTALRNAEIANWLAKSLRGVFE